MHPRLSIFRLLLACTLVVLFNALLVHLNNSDQSEDFLFPNRTDPVSRGERNGLKARDISPYREPRSHHNLTKRTLPDCSTFGPPFNEPDPLAPGTDWPSTLGTTNTWCINVYKGDWLLCQLTAPASYVTQSLWRDFDLLEECGWDPYDVDVPDFNTELPLAAAFASMSPPISDFDLDWQAVAWHHTVQTTSESCKPPDAAAVSPEKTYQVRPPSPAHKNPQPPLTHTQPTQAQYRNIYNVEDGVILAVANFSPNYEGPRLDPPVTSPIVPLKQWSDVAYLQYVDKASEASVPPSNLKYVFRIQIENEDTISIMTQALEGAPLSPWPGTKVGMSDDRGKALLSTPNGNGVAWLLAQHKAQLGVKIVTDVTMFATGTAGHPDFNLCFWIADYAVGDGQLGPGS